MSQLSQMLEALRDDLHRELRDELLLLILYGSHARGEARDDSDIDIFVVLRRVTEALSQKVHDITYRLMEESDFTYFFSLYLIDAKHYSLLEQKGSSFLNNVKRDGKILWQAM
ncbi:MAG: nucleotidyltransferase domain-containing protein [Anaerolineae bacterium]